MHGHITQAAAANKEDKQLAAAAKAEIDKLMALKAEVAAAETGCVTMPYFTLCRAVLCFTVSTTVLHLAVAHVGADLEAPGLPVIRQSWVRS